MDTIYTNYVGQLDWQGCGDVVASPDDNPDYRYHWMRDAALSYHTFMEINNYDYATISPKMDKYVTWVQDVQNEFDSQVDVRVEPKFYIDCPNGGRPYDQGWCRPQTDGPALRAMSLSEYGMVLVGQGLTSQAESVYQLVLRDMEWVVPNWQQNGCDLWEEVQSNDFYWNRAGYVKALHVAADFSDALGKSDGPIWTALADGTILPTVLNHYNGQYIYESSNRPEDSAVIHAIATFGDVGPFSPTSFQAADTLTTLIKTFCNEYSIVQTDAAIQKQGTLLGRYPGDTYQGGNPWQLLTAVTAEVYYKGATAFLKSVMTKGEDEIVTRESHGSWLKLLHLEGGITLSQLAGRQIQAGDAIMTAIYDKVRSAGGRVDEQIDRDSGSQKSAISLTWSYANILSAWHHRKFAVKTQVETAEFLTKMN